MSEELQAPKLQITLPKLTSMELGTLDRWAVEHFSKWPTFCVWLREQLDDEIVRRSAETPVEPGMIELPGWNGAQLSQALIATYILVRLGITPQMAAFLDNLHLNVMANCAAALDQFNPEVAL